MLSLINNIQAENKWMVRKIQVIGLHRIPLHFVLNNISIHINQLVSKKDLNHAIYSLFSTKKFKKIQVLKSNNTLIFKLKERLIISHIFIHGTKIFPVKKIARELYKLGVVKGTSINLFSINIFKKKIENFYKTIGKYQFYVRVFYKKLPNNCIDINIFLFDGYFYFLDKINITGINNFPLKKIFSLLKTKKKSLFWNIMGDKNYYPKNILEDLKTIQNFYFNHGYIHFFINSIKLSVLDYKKTISVVINIHEGEKYHLSKILVHGNFSEYCRTTIEKFHRKFGTLYNLIEINNLKQKLLKIFLKNGFNDVKIIFFSEINENKKFVKLHINLYPGTRFTIHKIYFTGNKYTKNSILSHMIGVFEGDFFRKIDVYNSQEILKKTGFFKKIKIDVHFVPNHVDLVDVIFNVQENDVNLLNFSSGYGIKTGVNLNLNLIENNWFGTGQLFKVTTLNNNYQTYGELLLENPYWTEDNKIFTNRVFYDQFNGGYNNFPNYIDKSYGFSSSIGLNLNKNNKFKIGLGYVHNGFLYKRNTEKPVQDFLKIKNILSLKSNINQSSNDITINYFLENYYSIFSDSNWLNNFFHITGKITVPGSDNSFYKLLLESKQSIYLDKQKLFRLLFHSSVGISDSWILNKKPPFYENFYAGGLHSIRGFLSKSIGPKFINYDRNIDSCLKRNKNNLCDTYSFVGGNHILITNLDLFIPNFIFSKLDPKKINSSIFLDMGTVWDTHWKNILNNNIFNDSLSYKNSNQIHASMGLSLNWNSSLGAISISYAEPIGNYDNYQIEKFQFNIGKIS